MDDDHSVPESISAVDVMTRDEILGEYENGSRQRFRAGGTSSTSSYDRYYEAIAENGPPLWYEINRVDFSDFEAAT